MTHNSTTPNKKFVSKNKTEVNKVEIGSNKKNPNEKPSGVHNYEYFRHGHYVNVCTK